MKYLNYICTALVLFISAACDDDDFPVPQASTIVPKFSFTTSNEGFAPDSITFTNETVVTDNAGTVSYTWNFGDGSFSTVKDPIHYYENPGTYEVKLVITGSDQIAEATTNILVKDPNALFVDLYYIDGALSFISDVNGKTIETQGNGYGVEYDAASGHIYYSDEDNGKVWRMNLDGTGEVEITSGLTEPRDLAFDLASNRLWVVDRGVNSIIEVDLSDNSSKVLYSTSNGLGELPVGIDYYDEFLYITCVEIDSESIWKANADGSGVENIINYGQGGYGYSICIDEANEKIYFDNRDNFELLMANLDGSDITSVAETNGRVWGLAVDSTNGKIYWSDQAEGVIRQADLDGSNVTDIAVELEFPLGLFFIEK